MPFKPASANSRRRTDLRSVVRVVAAFSIALVMMVVAAEGRTSGEDWLGWRGPRRSGVSGEGSGRENWSATEGVKWKASLPGGGIASPIVTGHRVIVATSDGPKQSDLHLLAFDRDTGNPLWHRRFWGTAPTLFHAAKGGMASPTPVSDGKNVYAFYGTGDVFCLDLDGGLRWHRSLASEYGPFENRFGHTSSPLVVDDLLVVQCDHYGESYLIALDVRTGANRWKVDRPGVWHSWASPQLVDSASGPELIVCSSEVVEAFAPRTGEKLWTVKGMQRECIPTPVVGDGLLYAVSGPKGKTFAIQPGGRGDVTESHVRWQSNRGGPFVPSPILVDGLFYLVDDQGIATCLDAKNGDRVWQKRLPGEYTASPIAVGDRIYFFNEAGDTIVLRAGTRQFEQLARNPLEEPIYATPAFSAGKLFIRTSKNLVCIE